ncbi:Oidioi.mRNA.OKI2018_I69.PAR.g8966.t1.cds [Oikopleura dioica]|uniref:Oidioi.mRNA.OKI2018_I69.PAR.g8966.t1.cds n=1 Tax=Oikopleura dioica TaxID=34765 RepID=A0ABN7RMX7_OIKDI|nr:Oidioi.mRNA.OKI2018_I69.PAR.g8966.t1.cds [Oikopleura dioica]
MGELLEEALRVSPRLLIKGDIPCQMEIDLKVMVKAIQQILMKGEMDEIQLKVSVSAQLKRIEFEEKSFEAKLNETEAAIKENDKELESLKLKRSKLNARKTQSERTAKRETTSVMLLKIYFLIFAIEAQRGDIRDDCPDAELGEVCFDFCEEKYIKCLSDCTSSYCELECAPVLTDCYTACPCFRDCPEGCENCPNSICLCVDPENNPYTKQCSKAAFTRLDLCLESCYLDKNCMDDCLDNYKEEIDYCPCMKNCPMGCSCEGGYTCPEHVTVLCQSRSEDIEIWRYTNINYVISTDGKFKENRFYEVPQTSTYPYLEWSGHAILRGEVYFFGSRSELTKKIAKLSGCRIETTKKQLLNAFDTAYGSLVSLTGGEMVILCQGSTKNCESFDGEKSQSIVSTKVQHESACMAQYKNAPIIVGSHSPRSNRVEIYTPSSQTFAWEDATAHPENIFSQTCLSVINGVLTIGGYLNEIDDGPTRNIYLYRDDQWSLVGELQYFNRFGSSIYFGDYFLVFGGNYGTNYVEKVIWDGQNVTSSTVINIHEGDCRRPIIFESDPDVCSENCQDFCYYQYEG